MKYHKNELFKYKKYKSRYQIYHRYRQKQKQYTALHREVRVRQDKHHQGQRTQGDYRQKKMRKTRITMRTSLKLC
eukprot:4841600-Amphidinium_carterae.1